MEEFSKTANEHFYSVLDINLGKHNERYVVCQQTLGDLTSIYFPDLRVQVRDYLDASNALTNPFSLRLKRKADDADGKPGQVELAAFFSARFRLSAAIRNHIQSKITGRWWHWSGVKKRNQQH